MIKTKTIVSIVSISALIILALASIILPCIPVSFAIAEAIDLDSNLSSTSINLFKSYVSPGVYTVSGLTFTVNYDYSVELEGTATSDVQFMLGNTQGDPNTWGTVQKVNFPAGSYYCSLGSVPTSDVLCQFVFVVGGVNHWVSADRVFAPTSSITSMTARIFVNSGTVINKGDFIFKLQFQQGTVATPYQPNLERIYELGVVGGKDSMQETISDLQNKNQDLQNKLDTISANGALFSNLSVNSVSRLSSSFYSDNTINGELKKYNASSVDIIHDTGNSGMSSEIDAYPDDVTYQVMRWNGTGGGFSDPFNNGNSGVGITVPITSYNNDLGYVPANADMTLTLHDTYIVSLGNGYTGRHRNILSFVFYDKEGNVIHLTKDNWLNGTSQYLNRRGTWFEMFGSDDVVSAQFSFPNFGQSYTFNLPVDVYFIGVYCLPTDSSNYSVGYNIAMAYQSSSDSDYVYDLGYKDGASSVNTQAYYDEGYRVGQEIGYSNGSKAQGDYTFLGLIGAVIDAPINSFRQMFNFEVLGVNMSSFMLSLLSLSLVCVVLRIALGGNK